MFLDEHVSDNFYIKQSRVMVVGRMTTGSVCDRQQKETAIMAMVTDQIEFFFMDVDTGYRILIYKCKMSFDDNNKNF